MRFRHRSKTSVVDPSAYVAPNAVLCGDVRVGPGCAVGFGAVLSAEDGSIELGRDCIVMENAVIKATEKAPVKIGNHVLVGPRAYLTGCTVEDDVFLATGCVVFNHAVIEARAEVRINGVVHLRTRVPKDGTVPIGWVAVGDPVQILPPHEHDKIWRFRRPSIFPRSCSTLRGPPRVN